MGNKNKKQAIVRMAVLTLSMKIPKIEKIWALLGVVEKLIREKRTRVNGAVKHFILVTMLSSVLGLSAQKPDNITVLLHSTESRADRYAGSMTIVTITIRH